MSSGIGHHLALHLLGRFDASLHGAPLGLRYDKLRALLAYLAVEAGRPHPREALASLLWPETPDADARRNLSQALFNLRQALGEGSAVPPPATPFLLASREALQFNPASPHTLDVAAFQTLLDTCAAHPHARLSACDECAVRLQQAAELYQGDFLAHFFLPDSAGFEEWALLKREELRRAALQALVHLTGYAEQQTDYPQAAAYARRQLTLEPWREEAHRDLMRLLALGGQRSAALAQYEACRQVLADELGVSPSAETEALHERIRSGEFHGLQRVPADAQPNRPRALSSASPPPALPVPATPFVGRAHELAEIAKLLADPTCRLLTLAGPGGIGKTRLALKAAAQQAEYQDQVYFLSLAAVAQPASIVPAIAQAMNLSFSGPAAAEAQLLNHLGDRRALLVLDNMEHLVEAAPLLVEILQQAVGLKMLVTSRERLNLHGEWVVEIEGMQVPSGEAGQPGEADADAFAFFQQTARRASAGFTLTAADRPAVAQICRLVGGMPLAIEIAAGWTRTLTCQEIAAEIARSLDFLTTSMRDVPARHRSVRGVFEQTWQFLSEGERRVLRQLSVFRGAFSREAAEQIAQASLPTLASLVAKSLLRRQETGRYELHELVRQLSAEYLDADPAENEAVQQRHAQYYARWLAAQSEPLRGARQTSVADHIRHERANWRAAWQWATLARRLDLLRPMIPCLYWYYEVQGYYAEAIPSFQATVDEFRAAGAPDALTQPADLTTFAFLVDQLGWFLFRTGQVAQASALFGEAERLAQAHADHECLYYIRGNWGYLALLTGDMPEAERLTQASLASAQALGSAWHMAIPLNVQGMAALMQGRLGQAAGQLRDSLKLWRTVGDPRGLVFCLNSIAMIALAQGHPQAAATAVRESITITEASGDRWARAVALDLLGQAALAQGQWAEARDHLQQSVELYRAIGDEWGATNTLIHLAGALTKLEDHLAAWQRCSEAFAAARKAQWWATALEALVAAATLDHASPPEASLVLTFAVLAHPALTPPLRARAEHLHNDLLSQVSPTQAAAAQAQAEATPFDQLAPNLLSLRPV